MLPAQRGKARIQPELLRIQVYLFDILHLLMRKTAEIGTLVTKIRQLSRAREVPEDMRLVARRNVRGLEVDAPAGA